MLAKANRVRRPADFRTIVRRGRRASTTHATIHLISTGEQDSRFGFIVSKAVGGAVQRNLVRRRLRAVCVELLPQMRVGNDVVIRALPGSAEASWASLQSEIVAGIDTVRKR